MVFNSYTSSNASFCLNVCSVAAKLAASQHIDPKAVPVAVSESQQIE